VVVGRNGFVVDVMVDEGTNYVKGMAVAEVVDDGGGRGGRAELCSSAPGDEGYRGCIASL
jgi:hypothetical protein